VAERPPVRVVRTGTGGSADFGLSQPRTPMAGRGGAAAAAAAVSAEPAAPPVEDYLDIPAFLRRQAD
jgi:hypothetical protein